MSSSSALPEIGDVSSAPAALAMTKGSIPFEQHQHLTDAFTRVTDDNARLKEELSALKMAHDTETILNRLIVPYALRAFVFMCVYCCAVFGLLITAVCGWPLPSPVLQTLVGSTAAAVVGLVGMVLTGIFVGARHK